MKPIAHVMAYIVFSCMATMCATPQASLITTTTAVSSSPAVVPPTVVSAGASTATEPSAVATGTPAQPQIANVIAHWRVTMPEDFAFGFDSVWVPSHNYPNSTTRIDPTTNTVVAMIKDTGYRAHQARVIGEMVWVTGEHDDLAPIDPKTNTVGASVKGSHPYIAAGFDSIWGVTSTNELDRIEPTTKKIMGSIKFGDGFVDCNNDVLVTSAAVWIDYCDKGELIKVDPTNNSILSKTPYKQLIGEAQAHMTVPTGKATAFIWRTLPTGLLRIDPTTGAGLTFLPLQPEQVGDGWVTVTDDAVWLSGDGQIERVSIDTNQIDATYKVHAGRTKVGIGFGSVWVAYETEGLVERLDIRP